MGNNKAQIIVVITVIIILALACLETAGQLAPKDPLELLWRTLGI